MILLISILLSWVSTNFTGLSSWWVFLAATLLGAAILLIGWLLLQRSLGEALPRWLAYLLIGAALFRLAMGVVWYVSLPVLGHGSIEERAGYIMSDAYARDQAAWDLAKSSKSLFHTYPKYRKVDQYGGMLFLSAAYYRYFGGSTHEPLTIVVLTAAISALAIIFTWAFARLAWGDLVGRMAAWGLAIYPEAVLVGSSQMREAFAITFTAMAFYGLIRYQQDHRPARLGWVLVPLLLSLPLSPPFAGLLLVAIVLTALLMRRKAAPKRRLPGWQIILILSLVALLILAAIWVAWKEFAPSDISNPLELFTWWIVKTADWQAYINTHASGWMQKIFHSTPEYLHAPLLIGYGVLRPFLPAALIAGSEALIWPWITIWRAIGWTILLLLLVYAPLRAWSVRDRDRLAQVLTIVIWLGIIIASFRGGGDQDDNPRYRAVFASLQIALAAWAWVAYRRSKDAGFRRALVSIGIILLWFVPWYLRRYTPVVWPVVDLFKTIGLGVISAVLYILWDWARGDPHGNPHGDPREHSLEESGSPIDKST